MPRTVGGHVPGPTLAAAPRAGWNDPAVGNLVRWDDSGDHAVAECASDDVPIGRVIAINPARSVLTIELFAGGMVAVLPYSGSPARGDRIEADGTADAGGSGRVRSDNVNGIGRVIAIDRVPGHVDVYFG